jgi:TRAP-type C4-dicarboxylate transport system substrate-binding protein
MKRIFCTKKLIVAVALLMSAILFLPSFSLAKKAEDVKVVFPAPLYPEYGELLGLNMYYSALQGRVNAHPDLKKKVKINMVDKGMLCGNQDDCLTMVSTGTAQMSYGGPHFFEQWMPEWRLGEFPGLFDNWSHFLRSMNTPVWRDLQERMAKEKGVTILKWVFDAGRWYFFSSKGPIKSLEDIKGQKIRIAGGVAFAKAVEAMGCASISLPYTDVVTSLQTNMIDGLLTDMAGGVPFYDLPRYTKYLVPVPITIQPIAIVVNTSWWQALEPKVRTAMMDVFDRIYVNPYYEKMDAKLIKKWDDDPKTILNTLSSKEAEKWRETMKSGASETLKDIDPKYMDAIKKSR